MESKDSNDNSVTILQAKRRWRIENDNEKSVPHWFSFSCSPSVCFPSDSHSVRPCLCVCQSQMHYGNVIMGTIASQITSLTIVYSTVYSDADQRNIKAPRHWPLCGEFTENRWIPRTNGQLRGKCFHLMTSLWVGLIPPTKYIFTAAFHQVRCRRLEQTNIACIAISF